MPARRLRYPAAGDGPAFKLFERSERFSEARAASSSGGPRGESSYRLAADSEGDEEAEGEGAEGQIVTTEEEIEGYHIVKAIVREVIDASRVFIRDTHSYCGILLDDNNRKPICRLRFNSSKKYLVTFSEGKERTRHPINDLSEM